MFFVPLTYTSLFLQQEAYAVPRAYDGTEEGFHCVDEEHEGYIMCYWYTDTDNPFQTDENKQICQSCKRSGPRRTVECGLAEPLGLGQSPIADQVTKPREDSVAKQPTSDKDQIQKPEQKDFLKDYANRPFDNNVQPSFSQDQSPSTGKVEQSTRSESESEEAAIIQQR